MQIKHFENKSDQLKWIADNQNILKAQRRAEKKNSDSINVLSFAVNNRGERLKSMANGENEDMEPGVLRIKVVLNTTNLLDSHGDVHLPGIWKKTLAETALFYLTQEHDLCFDKIISDEIKAYTQVFNWKDLGFNYDGKTEALVFEATVREEDNELMYSKYKRGKVHQHSVGMMYMKDFFCYNSNDPDYAQFKDAWDKYYPEITNKDLADQQGWFYAVTEAKLIEGSAVPLGSNPITPTLEVTEVIPSDDNQEETNQADTNKSLDQNNEPAAATRLSNHLLI